MFKYLGGLVIAIPAFACSAQVANISEQIEISTVNGCPLAKLMLQNRSGVAVYVNDEAPMLSIVDKSGVSVRYCFRPVITTRTI